MVVPQVIYSAQARADLEAIRNYIAAHSGEQRANLIINRLKVAARNLAHMPGMGRSRPNLAHAGRAFPVSPWIIFYRPLEGLDGIFVRRILDGRRDLAAVFAG